jgi:hypothetical protein
MTSLERGGSDAHGKASPRKGSQEPSFDAETKKGSLVKEPAVRRVRSRSANHEIRALPPRAASSSTTMHIVEREHICWLARFIRISNVTLARRSRSVNRYLRSYSRRDKSVQSVRIRTGGLVEHIEVSDFGQMA